MALTRYPISRVTMFFFLLALPLGAFAADLATPSAAGTTVQWMMSADGYDHVELRIATPSGEVYAKKFRAGQTPSFNLQDLGEDFEDGAYTYELRLIQRVSPSLQKQLEAARKAGNDAAERKLMRAAGLSEPQVQTGGLRVLNGALVAPGEKEAPYRATSERRVTTDAANRPNLTPVTNDQVIPDDLIVQGSLCVGFDCVNNESFGFDTIRMKENNTRVKFEDTSAGSFPSNDWQLTANDSASGGSNKFSIEDITGAKVPLTITAGASTNSIFVDSTGRVGFRTSTPVLDLHVATSNTPAIRLEQNNSGGFTAQTWDIAGNEANFFVRDVTSGSRLPFRIRPGAPTSSIDIAADGDVGIGDASPVAKLSIDDAVQNAARVALTGQEFFQAGNTSADGIAILLGVNRTGNRQIWFADTAGLTQNSTNRVFRLIPNIGDISAISTDGTTTKTLLLQSAGGFVGVIRNSASHPIHVGTDATNGNGAHVTIGGVWTNGSSRTFKENITDLSADEAKAAVAALKPVRYNYKKSSEPYVGFIAEDVPDLVAQEYDRRYLSSMDIVATLTKVVQEQQKAIDELTKQVEELKQPNNQ